MSLINPSDVDAIAKIIMKYQLMDQAGDAGLKFMMPKTEMEKLQLEQMRLGVARQKKELYGDDNDYNRDLNSSHPKIRAILGMEALRHGSKPPVDLKAVYKTAEAEEPLQAAYKWATFIGNTPKEASHVKRASSILRSIIL